MHLWILLFLEDIPDLELLEKFLLFLGDNYDGEYPTGVFCADCLEVAHALFNVTFLLE
jgi:hypothetical protein